MDRFFEQILDSLSDALITVDQDETIVAWNKMAEMMFGYTKDEIKAKGIESIIPIPYREKHRKGYDLFVRNINTRESYTSDIKEFEALRKDGEIFPIELTHSLLKLSNDQYFITAIVRDISMRKRYELMRNRLEHITRHDLKNKLVIISLAARRLSTALEKDQTAQLEKYVDIVRDESEGLIALLDSTRELILLETGEYRRKDETIDLPGLIRTKTEQMTPLANTKDVGLVFHNRVVHALPLQADRQLLERALENLLKNAVEAEEPRHAVEVILRQNERGTPVLEIRNGGKAIPEEIQRELFSPYVTRGKKGGTGLGLYATKLIVETIHNWKLSFQSSPQETVFVMTFSPRTAEL